MWNKKHEIKIEVTEKIEVVEKKANNNEMPNWMIFILAILAMRQQPSPEVQLMMRFIRIAGFIILVAILSIIGAEHLIPQLPFL